MLVACLPPGHCHMSLGRREESSPATVALARGHGWILPAHNICSTVSWVLYFLAGKPLHRDSLSVSCPPFVGQHPLFFWGMSPSSHCVWVTPGKRVSCTCWAYQRMPFSLLEWLVHVPAFNLRHWASVIGLLWDHHGKMRSLFCRGCKVGTGEAGSCWQASSDPWGESLPEDAAPGKQSCKRRKPVDHTV